MQACPRESAGEHEKPLMRVPPRETDLIGRGCGGVKDPQVIVMRRDTCGNKLGNLEAGRAPVP